ncbi:MAG: hypothetical protein D3916_02630 [Candidatus Electrothrix sp. MAN1_4]|nr:hypothetical protein [Candidatus Electrothrix sp. MAN1_4]
MCKNVRKKNSRSVQKKAGFRKNHAARTEFSKGMAVRHPFFGLGKVKEIASPGLCQAGGYGLRWLLCLSRYDKII